MQPGSAVKNGMWIPRLDATNKPPDRGSIGDVATGNVMFRLPRVEEANHATEAIEDEGARVSLVTERAGHHFVVVDAYFNRLDAVFANEGFKARVDSNGEASSGTVFEDDKAGMAIAIQHVGLGQELSPNDTADPQLAVLRVLESRPSHDRR